MAIPESQLETWSHQGSVTQSSDTYNSIRKILESKMSPYASRNFDVFLQGSYGNDTNIYAESDVDIVIQLNDAFQSDLGGLNDDEKAAWRRAFSDATYGYNQFKGEVLQVLAGQYGKDVVAGDKAIVIAANGNRRKSDVIVAIQFRRYHQFQTPVNQLYTEGICFWNGAGDQIVNYPKRHSTNLTAKHQATGSWFKPTVRVLKNLRARCVTEGLIKQGVAPSYFLEGLLYNVPNGKFTGSYEDCIVNAINWIQKEANKIDLVCANEQYYLMRDVPHVCWAPANAEALLAAATKLWKEW